jgi:hypothetical protein
MSMNAIGQVTWVVWVAYVYGLGMQLIVCETIYICNLCNSYSTMSKQLYAIIMQLVYNYHGNNMLKLLYINPSIFNMWHYGDFRVKISFEILISTIHYHCSFYMVLDCDIWCNQKLPLGILIEIWYMYIYWTYI